ncbi:uncharacterized protein LOC110228451 [Arabidopsis lyrata subsp. lyrata]|uniref:uncharacterized protein LOC110228451 n=1 Tax=Arabidopsis lyrata subsp. lyrata TaxID=81972 RepID=UPI000A29B1C3|nr:uncharacterized protein LOC110228451 [Arabidopsis lyrata subsp. lyrata]|eukprot:XP_020881692.1 uncharacterized protein LOC110228451 [Arabidopsis lyrata subsp. lyrata]
MLGFIDDVATMLKTLGMGRLWRLEHHVYPKLVREYIATCRLTYKNPKQPKVSEGTLTLFLDKKHYNKTLFEICDIYGFTNNMGFSSIFVIVFLCFRKNPVVRYLAKIISSTLYFTPVIATVTKTKLPMMFYNVQHMLDDYTDLPAPDANVVAVLCDVLVKMKTTAPTSASRGLYVGTALTPLFIGCRLDLSIVKTDLTQEFMDIAYLIHTHCLKVGDVYTFLDETVSLTSACYPTNISLLLFLI